MSTSYQTAEHKLRDLQASDYERWHRATKGSLFESRERGMFLDLVRSTRFLSVLEIGCGTGRITETVAPHVGKITALDFSAASLAVLQAKKIGNLTAHCANACEGLPFSSGGFELVLACQVLHHLILNDLLAVLRECHRVLAPGGKLAFTAYNQEYFRYADSEGTGENGLYSKRFSRAYVQQLAASSGFRVREVQYYKAIPSRLAGVTHSQGATHHLDRMICGLPGVGPRLAGYMFPVLERSL
jgi:ubiquinone/menaquinone biosynthesis C-methylase UbiE